MIYRDSRIVGQLNPSDDAAGRALIAANVATVGAHFTKIQAHTAAKLGDVGKVGNAPIDAFERIVDRIDEATGHLMMRLAGIGQSRRGHRHLLLAQHIIKSAHVVHTVLRFAHCQMQCNIKIHFLRRLQLLVHEVAYRIAAQEQVQAAIRQQSIAFGLQESLS